MGNIRGKGALVAVGLVGASLLGPVACGSSTPSDESMGGMGGDDTGGGPSDGSGGDEATGGGGPSSGGQGSGAEGGMGGSSDCAIAEGDRGTMPVAESGTRLKVMTLEVEGAPPAFRGFYDTELEVPCDFVEATDGQLRCLPRDPEGYESQPFADAECTRAFAFMPSACLGRFKRLHMQDCSGRYGVRSLEELNETTPRYQSIDGDCTDSGYSVEPADGVLVEGDELDPETFVGGTVTRVPGDCNATVLVLEADDGARAPYGIEQTRDHIQCASLQPDSSRTCYPAFGAFVPPSELFSSPTCEGEALALGYWFQDPTCREPAAIENGAEMLHVGARHEGDVYQSFGEDCSQETNASAFYEIGEVIPAESFPFLDVRPSGTGRLRPYLVYENDRPLIDLNALLSFETFYDTESETECRAVRFDDGVYRCIPSRGGNIPLLGDVFLDDACSDRVSMCTYECDDQILLHEVPPVDCTTEPVWSGVFQHDAVVSSGNAFFSGDGAFCTESSVFPEQNFWSITELDPTDYPVVEASVEE